jgi:hypothetical protein
VNRTKLKNYAPQARKDFIHAVTAKAAQYGLTASKIEPMTEKGDVVLISGKPFPKAVGDKRKRLEDRIKKNGFEYTMEAMAYTWFNRLVAVRYMELHGYLEHGFRVLSHPEGHAQPEILEKAQYVDLPGLDQEKVIELKLDGTKEEDLYRLLLTAQFNALSKAMPFLFEKIDDETELLLPDNLLNSDSLIRKLVTEIDEEDWKEVEIIGWLYQFYISDKKDEVIGKVVKSEDIPAATQLFTPNWIVKYLVQNTIGRQWLATYPQSSLRSMMEYYIEPAEQTPEVQEQLRAITPTSLNPEELTLLDPACGSGHILVEAYDLFKAIYEERGYRSKDIPALILQKNLFGLEIDDRAAQLAAFALMMKARADYPRIFDSEAQPNVVLFVESKGLDADEIHYALMSPLPSEKQAVEPPRPDGFLFETENNLFTHASEVKAAQTIANRTLPDITKEDIASLVALFENAKTFGSLIQVPSKLAEKLPLIQKRLDDVLAHGDLTHSAARVLTPLLSQAFALHRKHDAIVANPPYMGSKFMKDPLKSFVSNQYKRFHHDLFSASIVRFTMFTDIGNIGFVCPFNWMFLSSYEELRTHVIDQSTITSAVQLEFNAFEPAMVSVAAFTLARKNMDHYRGFYIRLSDFRGAENQSPKTLEAIHDVNCKWRYLETQASYRQIPGVPIAYWISSKAKEAFSKFPLLDKIAEPRQGLATSDDRRFVRIWHEVSWQKICLTATDRQFAQKSQRKWFPFNKGGRFRRWSGNLIHVINWENDGQEVIQYATDLYKSPTRTIKNMAYYFRPGITWSNISNSHASFREFEHGVIISHVGPGIFSKDTRNELLLGYLNSIVANYFLSLLGPTLHFEVGQVKNLPYPSKQDLELCRVVQECVELARCEWNSFETSWDFKCLAVCELQNRLKTMQLSQAKVDKNQSQAFYRMKQLEEENNRIHIEAFGLQAELSPYVPDDQITLYRPDREEDIKRLLSYAIGCVMGRYSLDKPGLVYAHAGNEGFDSSQYKTLRADDDGIIPLLESDWGIQDDAANRIFEFVSVAWPKEHLNENLKFIADSLTPTNGEQPRDTIRRYLATGFYKHHLSMYKKRPIYWMFSSGKQRAFQCLVYLHRYNEGTLARMRTEYVIPLMGKMTARLEHLQGPPEQKGTGGEIAATSAVTVKRKLEKERDNIKKQLAELQAFDEKLRHYADLRIKLDLDDGVKVNYGKFSDPEIGDILAEVKAICGTKEED